MLPKRRFWKSDERLGTRFRSAFQRGEYSIWATFLWKVVRKFDPKRSFGHPKSSFGEHKLYHHFHAIRTISSERLGQLHASQTKIFEGRTKDWVGAFQGCEYSIWTTNHWKCIEKTDPIFCSAFQNLRLGDSSEIRDYYHVTIFCDNFGRWLQRIVAPD